MALLQFAKPLEEELADRTAAMEACRQRFLDAGVDLTSFSTPHSAADLAIIREALGIEAWHLFGVSYGTRLSLESMRSHPEGIVTTILDSAYPSTTGGAGLYRAVGERVFDELVATCAATDCSIANPDLAADLAFIREEYNENPIELTGEVFGEERTFQITGDDVMGGLFNAMYDTSLIPVIPSVIGQFADGDTTLTREFLDSGLDRLVGSAEGMGWATDCADNGNRSTPDEFDAASRDAEAFTLIAMVAPGGMCHAFPVPPVDPAFNEPVDARIPALVLGGSLDPITPPENVQEVAQHLDFAFPIVWPQVGHGVIFADDCAMELAVQWLRESGEAKNVECLVDRDDRAPWQPIVDG
ncbi:MAG: alpha/beta hydrolase [Actinomycetota bacterium]